MIRPTAVVVLAILACAGRALAAPAESADVYLFTSFRGNGEDGLHLAWSTNGYHWTVLNQQKSILRPQVGGKLMRDPHLIQAPDGRFHMVWTTAWNKHGVGYAHSTDLVNWSEQKLLDVMKSEPGARNVWAPEMVYDEPRKQFFIFWSSTIPGKFPATEKVGDDGYNHRIYCVTTADFETFSPTRLLYEPGFNVIDATIIQDGGGYLMFLKDETRHPPAKNLRLATSSTLEGPYSKPSAPITGKYWAEGPTALKIGDRWHVYFDRYTENRYGLVTSADLQQWQDESDKVQFPRGQRHGSVLRVKRSLLDPWLKPSPGPAE